MADLLAREIFSVGTWNGSRKVTATTDFLDKIVESYTNLNSKVPGFAIPIKLGHNKKIGEPAYGYATNVRREDQTLLADFTDMPSEIVDAIGAKRYNSVSVELWPSITWGDQTFEQVLGGVALLGAEWPAVKGLKPLFASEFAEQGAILLSKEESEMPNTFTQEQHEALVSAAVETALSAEKAKTVDAEKRAEIAEAALSVFHEEAEKKDMTAIIEAAEKAGKIIPANKDKVVAFADSLRKSIKAEDKKPILDMFKAFVDGLPVKVEFSEKGKSESADTTKGASAQVEVMDKVKLAQKADRKLSFRDALAQVLSEDEDLKTRYAEETH